MASALDDTHGGSLMDLNGTDLENIYFDWCSNTSSLYANDTLCNNGTNVTGNSTDGGKEFQLPHSLWLTVVLGIAASVVIIVTVLGNILVLLSFALERTIRQPTNYFIASLAMSDLLIGTFSMPCFTLYLLLGYWPLGEIVCDLWLSLDWTVCLASQYTVFFITMDRFCSVKIPAKYRNWRTDKKVRVMIALSWIIPSVVFFTSIIGWQYFVGERTVEAGACEVQFMSDPLFTFLLTIGYYWTTLIVMISLYVGIYRVALALQRKSNEKQKKMNHAMELSRNKNTKQGGGGAKSKESKKRVENNNARHLRGVHENNTLTTSFSRHSDNEYSKPSEEDRSSSPAFASDEDEGSSAEMKKEGCYVNSAVQTEPTLKGMLGSSVNHMSRLAFSLSGTSVSASQASSSGEKDSNEDHPNQNDSDHIKPLLPESDQVMFKPVKDSPKPGFDSILQKDQEEIDHLNESATPLIESDVLDGIRYIDEDSLKSLTSTDNMKLLAEIKEITPRKTEAESPVWRKRNIDDDKSLLVPHSGESGSSEAMSSSVVDTTAPNQGHHDRSCNNTKSRKTDSHKVLHKSKDDKKRRNLHLPNHSDRKSKDKDKKAIGSPLQSLVRSLRPSATKKTKPVKSKSENRARKALRTISIILGAYVLCWTPYHVMVFIIGICGDWSCINITIYYFTYWMCYLNSPINPFCYAFANAQFKRTFIRILKFDLHRT